MPFFVILTNLGLEMVFVSNCAIGLDEFTWTKAVWKSRTTMWQLIEESAVLRRLSEDKVMTAYNKSRCLALSHIFS